MARNTRVDAKADPAEKVIDTRQAEAGAEATPKNTYPKRPKKTARSQASALDGY